MKVENSRNVPPPHRSFSFFLLFYAIVRETTRFDDDDSIFMCKNANLFYFEARLRVFWGEEDELDIGMVFCLPFRFFRENIRQQHSFCEKFLLKQISSLIPIGNIHFFRK